jgi:hypothetical protein
VIITRRVRASAALALLSLSACAVPHDAPRRVAPPPMPGGWYGHAQPQVPRSAQQTQAVPVQQSAPQVIDVAQSAPARVDAWGQPVGGPPPMHATQPASAPQTNPPRIDPWASAPADTGASRVVAPHTSPQPAPRSGPIDQAMAAATGRQPVPGSAGLESRNVYDADGGPARALTPGNVGRLGGAERELELGGSGRMYLLEMYQQALDEREALEIEVGALTSRIEQLLSRLADSDAALTSEREARATLERDVAALRSENQDLAGRLVTAQIRRLEAEKMLLEARIEQERATQPAPEAAQRPQQPSGRP